MNIQYHMITAVAHIHSLDKMRQVHGLTNSVFMQLYVNELADTLHVFANLMMPLTASEIVTISDAAIILLNVYNIMSR